MDETRSWRDLAALLTDSRAVAEAAKQAVADPVGYFDDHKDALADRGIDGSDQVTATIAFSDALIAAQELAYLDWNADPDDVVDLLVELPRVRDVGVDFHPAEEFHGGVEAIVAAVNRQLEPADVVVIVLDEDSDAYPLVAVPLDQVPRIQDAAARAAVTIRLPETPQTEHPDAPGPATLSVPLPHQSPTEPVVAEARAVLRDPRQSVEHYQAWLDSHDVEQEVTSSRSTIKMAVEIDEPALTATIKLTISILGGRLST